MKRIMTMLGLAVVALAPALAADFGNPLKMRVPFAFQAAGKTLPAGDYEVLRNAAPGSMLVRGSGSTFLVRVNGACTHNEPAAASKVVFERHGEKYLLRSVWVRGQVNGFEVIRTRWEREMLAANSRPATVEIAAR